MTDVIQETTINDHTIIEHAGRSNNLVYVDDHLVVTNWDDTISILEAGGIPVNEDPIQSMNRVLGANGIRY